MVRILLYETYLYKYIREPRFKCVLNISILEFSEIKKDINGKLIDGTITEGFGRQLHSVKLCNPQAREWSEEG